MSFKSMAMKYILKLAWFLVIPILFLGITIFFLYKIQVFDLETLEYKINPPVGYESISGLKIVLFTDLHLLDSSQDLQNVRQVVNLINAQKPDIILFGGDMIASDNLEWKLPPARVAARFRQLKAPLGVFAVTGNHDWYYDGKSVIEVLTKSGVTVLDNTSVTFAKKFNLIGLSDPDGEWGPDAEKALSKIDRNLPTIALTHNPDNQSLLPESIKIIFAGHTHGGQMNLPIIQKLALKYVIKTDFSYGHYLLPEKRHLFLSKGIGTSWVRYRVNCPSDILVVNIK